MARLEVNTEQLLVAAREIAAAGQALGLAAARPPAHPPVAADEVSTSAAARLSKHGMVLASRATDGAAVLAAAAVAITQAAGAFTEMNTNNSEVVALNGDPGGATVAFTPAATINAPDPAVPIAPPVPRDGRVTAAVVESGNASAGSSFITGCTDHAEAFRSAARVVRNAKATVASALTGQTGPTLAAALTRFGTWADSMADHADTVKAAGQGHSERFSTTKQSTPRTNQFTTVQRQIAEASALNSHPATMGMYTPVLQKLQARYGNLQTQAGGSMQSYHLGELPAAPPPPPPVVPIVSGQPAANAQTPTAGGQPTDEPQQEGTGTVAEDGVPGGELAGAADDPALAALLGDPENGELPSLEEGLPPGTGTPPGAGADPLTTVSMLAGTLPGLLTGVVAGAAAIPAAVAQQAQGAVSQVVEGVSGAVSEFQRPDLDIGDPGVGVGDFGASPGLGPGGGGGGAGGTDPAAASTPLPPGGTGMMSTAATTPPPPPIAGPAAPGATTPASAASPAGMPMMMPPMAGMGMGGGGAGTRRLSEPDKEVYIPPVPNSEPVRGEVVRRRSYPTPTDAEKPPQPAEKTTTVTSARRGKRVITRDEEPQ